MAFPGAPGGAAAAPAAFYADDGGGVSLTLEQQQRLLSNVHLGAPPMGMSNMYHVSHAHGRHASCALWLYKLRMLFATGLLAAPRLHHLNRNVRVAPADRGDGAVYVHVG